MSKHLPALAALLTVALPLTACSGSDSGGSPSPTGLPSVRPTTPSIPPSVTPSSAAPKAPVRTAAELTKALLAIKDLPSGFSVEKDDSEDGDFTLSSSDPKCASFLKLMNTDNPPGSKASAMRSFSGGQDGPYIDEQLDAMGSAPAVSALQKTFAAAVRSCTKVVAKVPGQGSSSFVVREVSAPKIGMAPFAVRITGTSGGFAGVEITFVVTGIDDVVLAMTFVGAVPDDIEGATDDAATKAQRVLGAKAGS
jgi:hypothetical protein